MPLFHSVIHSFIQQWLRPLRANLYSPLKQIASQEAARNAVDTLRGQGARDLTIQHREYGQAAMIFNILVSHFKKSDT